MKKTTKKKSPPKNPVKGNEFVIPRYVNDSCEELKRYILAANIIYLSCTILFFLGFIALLIKDLLSYE